MKENSINRRNFLAAIPAFALVSKVNTKLGNLPISCNAYNWATFHKREGKVWGENIEEDITLFAKSGFVAFEPSINDLSHAKELIKALKKWNIAMPSAYVNSVLHEKNEVETSINSIIEIAKELKKYGTKIIVTNPSPVKWGSKDLKINEQLEVQARALKNLNLKLGAMDITLAYHTHDMEMAAGAREFHHMMQNTTVSFCFDLHWIFRGSENSELAVFDVLKMYGSRIVELHIRQSINGIWSETFTSNGDIDYQRVVAELLKIKVRPHLVIEQCLEKASPNTMNVVDAHIIDLKEVKNTFKPLLQS